ncbi:hypothetical protein EBZ80_24005 [bacterium]|nr:hypothetical protein [Betaproteobacteria bacterium]NDE17989.1 hypothetical protein [bacterium]
MAKRWYYLYVILYPSLGYKFYYGSRITDKAPEDDHQYFGSPVTFAQYNDPTHPEYQADALKVILRAEKRRASKKAAKELSDTETTLIKNAHANTEYLGPEVCLNRNAAGRFLLTDAQRRIALERSISNGGGFLNMTRKQHLKWASIGGTKSVELKTGLHAIPEEQMQEIRARGRQAISKKYSKTYQFLNPDGELTTIHNLKDFCRKNNLSDCHMRSVNCGRIKSHRGWRKPETC